MKWNTAKLHDEVHGQHLPQVMPWQTCVPMHLNLRKLVLAMSKALLLPRNQKASWRSCWWSVPNQHFPSIVFSTKVSLCVLRLQRDGPQCTKEGSWKLLSFDPHRAVPWYACWKCTATPHSICKHHTQLRRNLVHLEGKNQPSGEPTKKMKGLAHAVWQKCKPPYPVQCGSYTSSPVKGQEDPGTMMLDWDLDWPLDSRNLQHVPWLLGYEIIDTTARIQASCRQPFIKKNSYDTQGHKE